MPGAILSAASRRNIFELQRIGSLVGDTQYRLATGRKVNSAIDNPASFFTASALRGRAASLNRVVDDIGLKLQTLKAAGAALSAATGLVQNARSVLNAALAAPEPRPTATGDLIVSSADAVTDLAGVADGDRFSVQAGGAAAVTITITDADTPDTLLNALNAIDDISASFTEEGFLQISTTNGEELVLADAAGAPLAGLGLEEGTFDAGSGFSAARAAAAETFNTLRTQIDQLIGDATYNGVNLAAGDSLTILFNETGSSSLTIEGAPHDSAGLGISAAAGEFQSDGDIEAAQAQLTGALDRLGNYSSRLSSDVAVSQIRSAFSRNLANGLETGADDLTSADINEEGARLLSLQTRRGLASTALSLLQQSESGVLRLFD